MRTTLFYGAATLGSLSQVNAATLSSFPVYDETINFAQQSDSIYNIAEYTQNSPATITASYAGYSTLDEMAQFAQLDLNAESYTFLHTYA